MTPVIGRSERDSHYDDTHPQTANNLNSSRTPSALIRGTFLAKQKNHNLKTITIPSSSSTEPL